MRTRFWRAAATMVGMALAIQASPSSAHAQVHEDAAMVLKDSARAIAEVQGVEYKARTFATGMLKDIIDLSGSVRVWRNPDTATTVWMVDGRMKDPGKKDRLIQVSFDGSNVVWNDHDKQTQFTAWSANEAAIEQLGLCRELVLHTWNAADPFALELSATPNLDRKSPATVGGVVCDVVEASPQARDRRKVWSIGAADHLPRSLTLATGKDGSAVEKVTESTELKVRTFVAADFELHLPGGFAKRDLRTSVSKPAAAPSGAAIDPPAPKTQIAPMPSATASSERDELVAIAAKRFREEAMKAGLQPIATPPLAPAPPPEAAAGQVVRAAPVATASFLAPSIEMPLDLWRPVRIVPIRVDNPGDQDREITITSDDPSILTVIANPRVLSGQTIAHALVRPLKVGVGRLSLGDRSVAVNVVEGGTPEQSAAFAAEPRLLSPIAGAAVWGKVSISVAAWRAPGETQPALALRISNAAGSGDETIAPTWMSAPDKGPLTLASFEVDFSHRSAGDCLLWAQRTLAGRVLPGKPITVRIVTPDGDAAPGPLLCGECEHDYKVILPDQFGPPKPIKGNKDAGASGGGFFNNAGTEPRFRYPIEVPSEGPHGGAGWYQIMLTAGGDQAGGALPSVGITIDEARYPTTASAIAQPAWHRTPIGTPIQLEPGLHILRCDFVNDFYAPGGEKGQNADRNLRLDRIEVLRVASSEPSGAGRRSTADTEAMTMQSGAASAMSSPSGEMQGGAMMMQGGSSPTAGTAWPASTQTATRPPVRVAFDRILDGLAICGEVEIRGTVWWEDQKNTPPPIIALLINGREAQRQRTDAPRFIVPPERFAPGENRIALRAIADSGYATETAEQRLTVPSELAAPSGDQVRDSRRITIHDNGWSPALSKSLKDNQGGEQRKSAPLAQGSSLLLELPEDLHGDFDLFIESRSNVKPGAPERTLNVALMSGTLDEAVGPPRPVASGAPRTIPHWFDAHKLTDAQPLALRGGPKRLILSTPSAKGDKTALWLQAIRLVERSPIADRDPLATLDYPAKGQHLFAADALIASITSTTGLDSAEAVIDGTPTGLRFDLRRSLGGLGRAIVPFSLRGLSSGEHRVALRITDLRGRAFTTEYRTITALADAPAGGTIHDRAVTILDRFAYGPDPRQLAEILTRGPDAYLESKLAGAGGGGDEFSEDAATDLALVKFTNARSGYDVPRRAIQQSIATANPVRNRFTLWAENHFSTWIRKDEAQRKWDEHERFVSLGVARFYDLLLTSATSPAMLRYLDQERSYAGKLNENYAREIMELHTLGVRGGYSQEDVTNLAHILTGWTTARTALAALPEGTTDENGLVEEFRYEPMVGASLDKTPRDVIGYRFESSAKEDRHERVLLSLEMLCAHPSTATFVCTKLAEHYAGAPAPADLVADLASEFTRTGGDMKRILLAMSRHPAFWSAARAQRLAHPTDYAFRLARTSGPAGAGWMNPHEIGDFLGNAGQGLFDRPTPDGYPELDADSMDSNAILQRWKLASKADGAMVEGLPPSIRWSGEPLTADQSQQVVDLLAIRLTGRLLGETSNAQALKILEQSAPPTDPKTPVEQKNHDAQLKTTAAFIAQLPEANLR